MRQLDDNLFVLAQALAIGKPVAAETPKGGSFRRVGRDPILFAYPKNRITDRPELVEGPEPVEGLPPLWTTLRQAQGERPIFKRYRVTTRPTYAA